MIRVPAIRAGRLLSAVVAAATLALFVDSFAGPAQADAPYARRLDVPRLTALGREMFFDAALSASGRVSCASCHDPKHAYGPPNALPVQPGGGIGPDAGSGFRAAPSLRYLQSVPAFEEHHHDNDGDDSVDMGPTGGRTWDGRAPSALEQARLPLLSAAEMGNADAAAVVRSLRAAPYAITMRELFGADVFAHGDTAFEAALMALEVFQQSPADFAPYTSRYDAVLRGQATLTAQEARGLALFDDPSKGNCASCHLSHPTSDGAFPLFTDFGHIAIGVPRNRAIAANANPRFMDLGLCGPQRTDLASHADYCGRFRTPSLRNVAVRRTFFHNGQITSLTDAVRFYVGRDTDPAHWYGIDAKGAPRLFDDLPERFHRNLDIDAPFGGKPGDAPALNEAEIADVVAFLRTLTDADQTGENPPTATRETLLRCNPSSAACSTPTSTSSRCGRPCCTGTRRRRPNTRSSAATNPRTRSPIWCTKSTHNSTTSAA